LIYVSDFKPAFFEIRAQRTEPRAKNLKLGYQSFDPVPDRKDFDAMWPVYELKAKKRLVDGCDLLQGALRVDLNVMKNLVPQHIPGSVTKDSRRFADFSLNDVFGRLIIIGDFHNAPNTPGVKRLSDHPSL
jgi:hypothetical protein